MATTTSATAEHEHGHPNIVLATLALASVMSVVNLFIVNVALHRRSRRRPDRCRRAGVTVGPARRWSTRPAFVVARASPRRLHGPCSARNASIRRAGPTTAEHGGTQSRAITKPGLSRAPLALSVLADESGGTVRRADLMPPRHAPFIR